MRLMYGFGPAYTPLSTNYDSGRQIRHWVINGAYGGFDQQVSAAGNPSLNMFANVLKACFCAHGRAMPKADLPLVVCLDL